MDADAALQLEAKEWLAAHAPPLRTRLDATANDRERFELLREWQRARYDAGWLDDADPARARALAAEQPAFGIPTGFIATAAGMVAPALRAHATEAQRARYLPPLLRGDETWCQLFSEPAAGSDLAFLATRADRDGDVFVVNGQKVWSSNAHLCDFGMLLARTNPNVPKHRGITFFALDMRTPGVEVRPLRQITGAAHFNEVFLTDVRVPAACVIGAVDGGWAVARTVLANEASVVGAGTASTGFDALVELARVRGINGESSVRQALARAYTHEQLLRYLKGRAPASVLKIMWSEARRDRAALGVELLGAHGALDDEWPIQLLESFSGTIGGGTNEIHRTMIGEAVLQLPREARIDKDVAYGELARGGH
jgi:alkylation response protein AidB-like acyl-CoA dehydrogenase